MTNVSKSYLMRTAGHNLNIIMLAMFGIGTPRSLQGGRTGISALLELIARLVRPLRTCVGRVADLYAYFWNELGDFEFFGINVTEPAQ